MQAFPDTGPEKDGRRTAEQWINAMAEDTGIIAHNIAQTVKYPDDTDIARNIAVALKEARRLQSDIYRFAKEVHDISREEIDNQGPL